MAAFLLAACIIPAGTIHITRTGAVATKPILQPIAPSEGYPRTEIVLALDLSSSLCDDGVGPCTSGVKLDALKAAARDMIDLGILQPDSEMPLFGRIGIVPASGRVRFALDGDTTNTVVPLTTDKALLHTQIRQMIAGGASTSNFGIDWAWRVLSPKWNVLWPEALSPGPFSKLTSQRKRWPPPPLRKIVVLATDGKFASSQIGAGDAGETSKSDIKQLCAGIKSMNIEIFTVGIEFNRLNAAERKIATETLENCATRSSDHYNATTHDAVKAAFRDIVMKLWPSPPISG